MVKSFYITYKELIKLKKILMEYGRIEEVDYRQINEIDSNNTKQQKVEFIASIHMINKIRGYLRYYIYPFRKKVV